MLRAVCEPSAEEAVVENLTNYSAYTFKIQSQNTNGVLSTPVTVSVTPVPPAYEIESDYTLKVGGVSTESITGNGTYTVSLDVTNYSQADFAPALIIALYKDDKLVTFDKLENTISADGASKTLSTPGIELTDYDATAKYTISAFFWDGFNEMSPLYPCKSWANQQQ